MILQNTDCFDFLKTFPDNSIDSLITDPPAGISFMGKHWDSDKGGRKEWCAWLEEIMREVHRVLKPGAHGLVWAIPRTSHWTATALEDSGFEIRDVVTHLFGSGFPKSLNISKAIDKAAGAEREVVGYAIRVDNRIPALESTISPYSGRCTNASSTSHQNNMETIPATDEAKQWDGWGTALKPASEHWILIRKPISEKTVAANVLKWGTGGINIDGCRINGAPPSVPQPDFKSSKSVTSFGLDATSRNGQMSQASGRFPANLILDEEAGQLLDEQSGVSKSPNTVMSGGKSTFQATGRGQQIKQCFGDSGGASRFFYCAKVSTSERNNATKNNHPTVKPIKLMTYLCRLITPPNGTVLDPFMGSGSTGLAAKKEGFNFVGIEKDPEYYEIAVKRIEAS